VPSRRNGNALSTTALFFGAAISTSGFFRTTLKVFGVRLNEVFTEFDAHTRKSA